MDKQLFSVDPAHTRMGQLQAVCEKVFAHLEAEFERAIPGVKIALYARLPYVDCGLIHVSEGSVQTTIESLAALLDDAAARMGELCVRHAPSGDVALAQQGDTPENRVAETQRVLPRTP